MSTPLLPLRRASRGPTPPGGTVKLRVSFGDVPECGAMLVMGTGRRYMVLSVHGKTLKCLVLSPNDTEPHDGPVLAWQWCKRTRRATR